MDARAVISELKKIGDPAAVKGMERFGISGKDALGVPVPKLREMAKRIGRNHRLALELWDSGVHEARILASMVDEPGKVTTSQMDRWSGQFDSWDVCDSCCGNLFDKTSFAFSKAVEWSRDGREFVRRAGFSLMAELAVHDKSAPDEKFEAFFDEIRKQSSDERNFVKKAVNWALRQIGKRNRALNSKAVRVAEDLRRIDAKSARWIASDALRELKGEAVRKKLRKRT